MCEIGGAGKTRLRSKSGCVGIGAPAVNETYLKVRAVGKFGGTIDFYLSPTLNAEAAKRFLGKSLSGPKDWERPSAINIDRSNILTMALKPITAS